MRLLGAAGQDPKNVANPRNWKKKKIKEMDSALEYPEGHSPLEALILASAVHL